MVPSWSVKRAILALPAWLQRATPIKARTRRHFHLYSIWSVLPGLTALAQDSENIYHYHYLIVKVTAEKGKVAIYIYTISYR